MTNFCAIIVVFCRRGSRLKVSRVDTDDSGVYTCLARNAVGEASKNVTVKGGFPYLDVCGLLTVKHCLN